MISFSPPFTLEQFLVSREKLQHSAQIEKEDMMLVLQPEDQTAAELYAFFKQLPTEQQKQDIQAVFQDQLSELWQVSAFAQRQKENKEQFLQRQLKEYQPTMIFHRLTGRLLWILNEKDYLTVLTSRLFPLFSHQELEKIQHARIAIFGMSTGSWIAAQLVELGVGQVIGCDPDQWSTSNLSRAWGATIWDVGMGKPQHVGNLLVGINPYLRCRFQNEMVSDEQVKQIIEDSDVVVEMTDGRSKSLIREVATEINTRTGRNIQVVMGNNFGSQSSVFVDSQNASPFFKNLTDQQKAAFKDPQTSLKEKVDIIVNIVGKHNLSPRAMTNLILLTLGKQSYIAQHGANAASAGAGAVFAITQILAGAQPAADSQLNLPKLLGIAPVAQIQSDTQLLEELKLEFPEFQEFPTLLDAVKAFTQKLFQQQYDWKYE
jgi:molybdopterin/thiamine biosynthesis adenylyltransferase